MPTIKQKRAHKRVVENGGNVSRAMMEVGYSPATAKTPQKLTESKGWRELVDTYLDDEKLAKKHEKLLNSTKIDHMIFPLGPKDEDDINFSGAKVKKEGEDEEGGELSEEHKERTTLTDKEIIEMLAEVNCQVRRIVHGNTARHVYFWAADSKAQKDALDMAYKLKGSYAPDKSINLNLEQQTMKDEDILKLAEALNRQIKDGSNT